MVRVYDFVNGACLDGEPTAELEMLSKSMPGGVVRAAWDGFRTWYVARPVDSAWGRAITVRVIDDVIEDDDPPSCRDVTR